MDNKKGEILKLKQQLHNLGYHGYQIDSMLKDEVGTAGIEELTDEQMDQVVEVLQGYVQFAVKCHQSKK